MRTATLPACLLLAVLATAPAAQATFDYITFDKIRLDPNFALGTSTRWGIIVNTGTVPISLDNDWERGLCYAESSKQLGSFFYEPLNPFGNDFILQPGEAIGDSDPLLLAELLPGETFTTNALIASFQFGVPFPDDDFTIDVLAQIGDQIAVTRTDVDVTNLGGAAFWEPVTAKRVSGVLSPLGYQIYGQPCSHGGGSAMLYPRGHNGGPGGPPWAAYRSSMPQLGNWTFGLEIKSTIPGQSYLLALDFAPASFLFEGCEVLLGLTPGLTLLTGSIPFFQETINVPLPLNPNLAGLPVYFQALLTSGSFTTTNGVQVTLGDALP
jgi:hypothetical protein